MSLLKERIPVNVASKLTLLLSQSTLAFSVSFKEFSEYLLPFVITLEAYWGINQYMWLFVCFNYPAHTCTVLHWVKGTGERAREQKLNIQHS